MEKELNEVEGVFNANSLSPLCLQIGVTLFHYLNELDKSENVEKEFGLTLLSCKGKHYEVDIKIRKVKVPEGS